jgi:trans enoyl reductase
MAGGARSSVAPVTATREYDIVLYGATGFVGKLTAEYLAKAGGTARIALAGRSTDRLKAIRDTLGESAQSWQLLTADASSPKTLDAMAEQTQVVVTTVGPYSRYGLPLVAACAAAGTDYADLTGEPPFMRESIDLYHKQAQDTGARIVHACGFDSIPSDLSVYALYRRAREDGSGELVDTDFVVRSMSGGLSGGTIASGVEVMDAVSRDPDVRRQFADPYTLSPDRGAEPELGAQPDLPRRRGRQIAPELTGLWTAGFMMAPSNTRIVRRSNALQDYAYGRRFRYSEHMNVGSSALAPVVSAVVSGIGNVVSALGSRYFRLLPRKLVDRALPKPGTGPSEAVRERGFYKVETYTATTSGARYVATMAQQGDPGYKATAVLLGQSGLALAMDREALSDLHGVLTPAAAMGDALIARFPAAEVTLETARLMHR